MTLLQANSKNMRVLAVKVMIIIVCCLSDAIPVCCLSSSMHLSQPFTTRLKGNETDRLALLAIKGNIQHDPNHVLSSWNNSIHLLLLAWCDLQYKASSESHCVEPHLPRPGWLPIPTHRKPELSKGKLNNLTGEIPPSLGNLSSLTELGASTNNLVGSIPSSLGQLKMLTFFSLDVNNLSGTIPPSIYNLSAIVAFSVAGNQIQGSIPSHLSTAFPHLEDFYIWGNEFTGSIPLSISSATSLVDFDVSLNSLTGQVPNLRKLHNLSYFNVPFNHLGSGQQGDLSFVSDLTNATQLRRLDLGSNNFGGTLPTSISNLSTGLEEIWVGVTGLGNLANLQSLVLSVNFFTGSIPADIGQLSSLVVLDLHSNQLSGRIPFSLGNLTMLIYLYLDTNNLSGTGSIASSLGKCHGLLELDISQNNLNGIMAAFGAA
uniref:putative receptor-like protein kinase At3g47110 n=1 Tax=Fragaria vesca subsp. vesca TaxID=101020 RepID=UPI0005C92797|nr:PREDICTED: putative receptor-like protein kinase At3g47110 [Fragaria vesca subsp. vesca]